MRSTHSFSALAACLIFPFGSSFALSLLGQVALAQQMEAQKSSPEAIMDRLDTLYRTDSSRAKVTVEIVNKRYQRKLEMSIVTLGQDYSLITITNPRKERGVTTLKRKTEIWNYLPKIRRKVRLPPSMMSESWMGSDLTNDDLVREVSWKRDYTHTIDNELANKGQICVSSVPKEDVPIAWSRVLTCVNGGSSLPERQDFFDEKQRLARRMSFGDVKEMGGRTIPSKLTVEPQLEEDKGQSTTLTYLEIDFDAPVKESEFQVSRLGSGSLK